MKFISTPLAFTKMHGLGNDFMVLDATRAPISLTPEQIRRLADRHFGVGFDQLLLVEAAQQADVDFNYRIFNADGSEVEQCGNGARCFALYVHDKGLTTKNPLRVATRAGVIELTINNAGLVRVNMGVPKTRPADIPFIAAAEADFYAVDVAGQTVKLAVVNMGNPHAVLAVPCIEQAAVQRLGSLLETLRAFQPRSMWALCRCWRVMLSSFASMSAVRGKPWRVAAAPVLRSWQASAPVGWTLKFRCCSAVARYSSNGLEALHP